VSVVISHNAQVQSVYKNWPTPSIFTHVQCCVVISFFFSYVMYLCYFDVLYMFVLFIFLFIYLLLILFFSMIIFFHVPLGVISLICILDLDE